MKTKVLRLKKSDLALMIELMKLEYSDFENQEMSNIATQISKEFDIECLVEDIEAYYSDSSTVVNEDFELESRRSINNYYNEIDKYEDRIGFNQIN